MPTEEILDQPIHLNPYTKLEFSSDNLCFYFIKPKYISDNYNERSCHSDVRTSEVTV